MRMQPCPHCGAQNSVKRTTCYQCQRPLDSAGAEPRAPAEGPRPAPTSRWEAIETTGAPRAQSHTAHRTPPSTSDRASPAAAPTPRRYLPAPRRALGHVRTMGVFFRELYTLTRAGIAIAPACRELERRGPARLREMAGDMALAAEAGQPVSSAMEAHGSLLYPWHLGVIRAAEIGAFLPEAFEQIAHAYETEWETRAALRLRMFVYTGLGVPAILVSVPAIVTLAQPIPRDGWTPQLVLATVAHYFRFISLPIALGLVVLLLIWQTLQAIVWFQGVQQRIVITLPLVGRVARTAALDRYLATLGLMLRGGLPIAQAAEEAAVAAGNPSISPKLLELVPALRQGGSLSSLLEGTRLFDTDTLNMAATGEVSGALPDMLARASGYYREENESKRRMLLRLAGVIFGVFCLCGYGALIYLYVRTYFDFAFRVYDWMMQGFE